MQTHTESFTLAVPVNHADHVLGPASPLVTVVEYGDFECPFCLQAYPAAKMLLAHFAHKLRFVYRHFPLVDAHPHAELAAEAAEAAAAQGKFWPMHDLLFENQKHLKAAHLRQYAQKLELDLERYDYEMGITCTCSGCRNISPAESKAASTRCRRFSSTARCRTSPSGSSACSS